MTKKSFKDNPALQFITQQEEPQPQKLTPETTPAAAPAQEPIGKAFLQALPLPEKAPAGFKKGPEWVEVKSKRLQLVIQPSILEKVKEAAAARGQSTNDFIGQVLAAIVAED